MALALKIINRWYSLFNVIWFIMTKLAIKIDEMNYNIYLMNYHIHFYLRSITFLSFHLFFFFFVPRGTLVVADQNPANFIIVHFVVLEEIAEKEIDFAFYNIDKGCFSVITSPH